MSTWLSVWTRAVIAPAWRRALAVWVGSGIVAAILLPGMRLADLTGLALHAPAVGVGLAVTWLLLFAPTARVIVQADGARYLRALPGPWLAPRLVAAGALVAFQLPWLALWVVGDGLRGAAIAAGLTVLLVGVAWWPPRAPRRAAPTWRTGGGALCGIYLRALRRRAADVLVRGGGLALLAGATAGLVVRNNDLAGADAAAMGAAVIAVVVVPATVGPALALLETHRQAAWLVASLGIPPAARMTALVTAIGAVHVAAALLACGAAAVVLDEPTTIAWLVPSALVAAVGAALGHARVLLAAEQRGGGSVAVRLAVGAVVVAAISVLWLGLLGLAGLAAIVATALFALLRVAA